MTTTTASITQTATSASPLWRHGVRASAIAATATTAFAAIVHGAGVSFEIQGEAIPLLAFAQLTLVLSLVGVAIAVVLRRTAHNPRQAFMRSTVGLVAMSVVPDLLVDAAVSTKVSLMASHVIAAAIVIPAVAKRLA